MTVTATLTQLWVCVCGVGGVILHHGTVSPNTHIPIHILRPSARVIWVPSFTSYFILIFLMASANSPSLVLISLPSSSEPLSLPSSLTAPLNHVSRFLRAEHRLFPALLLLTSARRRSGFCTGVYDCPPATFAHTDSGAHAHPGLFSACCRGDKWILCCLATGWQAEPLGGERSI